MQLTSTMRAFWCVWDGVQQQVPFFGNEDVPLDVPRALDTSSSMHAVHLAVKSGARALLTKLREGDRALVVDVKQRVHVRAGLKAGLSHVVASINRLSTDGSTALCDGLYMSLQEFARERRQRPEIRRQAFVVSSDGLDNASHVRFEDRSKLARALDVTIYTITLHDGQLPQVIARNRDVGRAMWEMRALAFDTGGRAFFPSKVTEMQADYDTIARELVNQYTLAYVAPAAGQQQALRRISIRLLPPAQGVPRTRTSYLANQPGGALISGPSSIHNPARPLVR